MANLTQFEWHAFPADAGPQDQVSTNFKLYELTQSEIADRQDIPNGFPGAAELRAAVYLCRNVLQPIRDKLGRFTPNSVFRSQALERALKNKAEDWISDSQHTLGEACDVEIPGMPTLELARWAVANLSNFDQIICECYDSAKGPNSGWVHISLVPPDLGKPNRREQLSYIRRPGNSGFFYVKGLVASA